MQRSIDSLGGNLSSPESQKGSSPCSPVHVHQETLLSYSSAHLQPFSESLFQDKKGPAMRMVTDVVREDTLFLGIETKGMFGFLRADQAD